MLTSVKFIDNVRCFKKGFTIDFSPGVNLIVGDQGTGKSTLLQILGGKSEFERKEVVEIKTSAPILTRYFDTEKMNFRTSPLDAFDPDKYITGWMSRFRSHGEVQYPVVQYIETISSKEKTLFFIDEPDSAMSPKSIMKIYDVLQNTEKNGHQVIISVHNPLLILLFPEVIHVKTGKRISSKRYLDSQIGKEFRMRLEQK